MQYRKLGTAGTKVSVIAPGGWNNFEAKLPETEARNIIALTIERGINFFDMADVFRERAAEINKMIRSYNLKAPLVELHILVIDVEREIRQGIGA
jgi:aryl-alcohol dehydrogenase-like predicted oxidoreductase